MSEWTNADIKYLCLVIDRLIPADEWPSASDLGVDRYIMGQLVSGAVPDADMIQAGLRRISRLAGDQFQQPLESVSSECLDLLLKTEEQTPWFAALVAITAEGYYANPANGGNHGAQSWTMIGYEHRLPEGPDGPPSLAADQAGRSRTGDVPDDLDVARPAETGQMESPHGR